MIWPNRDAVIAAATPLIQAAEGFRPRPYICPAGKPTIGFGTTRYPTGKNVSTTDPVCTYNQAVAWMTAAMGRVLVELEQPNLILVTVTANQMAALLSLAYNVGVGAHDGKTGDLADSTLIAKLNRGDVQGAADQFLVWNKAHVHGVLQALDGLTTRRRAERTLFLQPDRAAA